MHIRNGRNASYNRHALSQARSLPQAWSRDESVVGWAETRFRAAGPPLCRAQRRRKDGGPAAAFGDLCPPYGRTIRKVASVYLTVHPQLDWQRKLGEFLTNRVRLDVGSVAVHQVGQALLDDFLRGARAGCDQHGFAAIEPLRIDLIGGVDQIGRLIPLLGDFSKTVAIGAVLAPQHDHDV